MILNFIIKILLVCVINCLETRLLIEIDGNMRSPEYKAIFSGRFRLRNEANNNKNGNWSICCSVFLTQCRYKPEIIYLCVFHSFLFGFCVFHLIKFDALKSSEKPPRFCSKFKVDCTRIAVGAEWCLPLRWVGCEFCHQTFLKELSNLNKSLKNSEVCKSFSSLV